MPFVFYDAAPAGSRVPVVSADQASLELELRDLGASGVAFVPSDPLDWPLTPPVTVEEAINETAARGRGSWTQGGLFAGASPFTFDTPQTLITPIKSGNFLMWWFFAGAVSGAGNVTVTPRVDNANGTGVQVQTVVAGANFSMATAEFRTLNRATTHGVGGTYQFTGNLSGAYIRVLWLEL